MGNIEIISGEVSGLGLIDILCIYIALWAMDELALVSMLDDESFSRLVENNPELVVGEAEKINTEHRFKLSITDALSAFEKSLVNVFSFVEAELDNY